MTGHQPLPTLSTFASLAGRALACLMLLTLAAQAQPAYRFSADLTNVQRDRIPIVLECPPIEADEALYCLPKVVPGTYSVGDYGRFLEDFKAFDEQGQELAVEKDGHNTWRIADARRLRRISYWVNDSWDANRRDNFLFEPAGTNIERGKVFVMNTFGFFGYFKGLERLPFEVLVRKPQGFYGSTSMEAVATTDSSDLYRMPGYRELADAPILYSLPDTAWLDVGGSDVLVSVYSPNGTVKASFIAEGIAQVLEAQRQFLGGKIPVEKYAFLICLFSGFGGSGYQGALEHSYSSLYYLPEVAADPELQRVLAAEVADVAAHEFFHILTPLNIHSEEIHYFDFSDPEMSEHLWLYEGVTEYFAGLVQAQYGIISEEDYTTALREKMAEAEEYRADVPFTAMSKGCLDEYEDQYGNVYEKGALIGLCLDLLLLSESEGKYRLTDLMKGLAEQFGPEKPFKDAELFAKIEEISGIAAVGPFFRKHVAGTEPLPLSQLLAKVGYDYAPEKVVESVNLGNIGLGFDGQERLVIRDISDMNAFGKRMGYALDDVITSINGMEINTLQDAIRTIRHVQAHAKRGDKLVVTVLRKKGGKEQEKRLKAKIEPTEETAYHVLEPQDAPAAEASALRKIWLRQTP